MACEELLDINSVCGGNAGGILKVGFADMSEVTLTYDSKQETLTNITTTQRFRNLPIKRGRGNFADTSTIDKNTGVSAISGVLTARLPHRRKDVMTAIKRMAGGQRELCVVYQDGNRKWWVLPYSWLSQANGATGDNLTDANQEELQFTTEGEFNEKGLEITEIQALALFDAVEPEITAVTPSTTSSSNTVVITGIGFTGATAVAFGATPATSYTVVNDTTISAVVPTLGSGSVNVTVTNAEGTSAGFAITIS